MLLPRPNGMVTLLTDFGTEDPYVGLVRGMVKRAFGGAEVVDLCHAVPPQDVLLGAFFLGAAVGRFPDGTVHLAVVDPGVGTDRRFLAVCARGCYWIGPDNGVLGALLDGEGVEVRSVDLAAQGLEPESSTFHGRDVFAPLAGRLAGGRYGFRALGPRIDDPVRLPALTEGPAQVVHVDHYGNLVTNLRGSDPAAALRVAEQRVPVVGTYGAAGEGELIALVDSYGLWEIAVVGGSAARTLGVGRGAPVALEEAR